MVRPPEPRRPRRTCPVCGKDVATDRQGRFVGHGAYGSCAGSYQPVQP
jgi:hypothetical protein